MSSRAMWIAALMIGAGGAPATAQAPVIRAQVDTTAITLGGRVHLTVTVEHARADSVAWPDSVALGPFELVDAVRPEPRTEGERTRSSAVFTLTAFELGELEIPTVDVTVSPPDGEPITLSTDAIGITVVSVGRDENGDIRDVKGPLDLPRSWLVALLWIAAFAAIGAAAYLLYRRIGRRPRLPPAVPPAPSRPPHLVAYEALDRLAASGMLDRGEVKPYYIAVSNIIREYIEGRFGIPALELATHEVLDGLVPAGLPAERYGGFERFLETCDLVKFAKHVPTAARSGEIIPEARRLVALTEPAETAAVAVAAATDQAGPDIPTARERGESG